MEAGRRLAGVAAGANRGAALEAVVAVHRPAVLGQAHLTAMQQAGLALIAIVGGLEAAHRIAEFARQDLRRPRNQRRAEKPVEAFGPSEMRRRAIVERHRRMGGGRARKTAPFGVGGQRAAAIDDDAVRLAGELEAERAGMGIARDQRRRRTARIGDDDTRACGQPVVAGLPCMGDRLAQRLVVAQ